MVYFFHPDARKNLTKNMHRYRTILKVGASISKNAACISFRISVHEARGIEFQKDHLDDGNNLLLQFLA